MNAPLKSAPIDSSAASEHAPFDNLFDGVEDLIKRVADVDSPEIQKMRAKVRMALIAAQSAAQDGATHVRQRARAAAHATDGYVRSYPWQALGVAALLGFAVGLAVMHYSDPE
jgi:ElaB/YqjD/DUF883 family membrane-anchored ribosome-binding protein